MRVRVRKRRRPCYDRSSPIPDCARAGARVGEQDRRPLGRARRRDGEKMRSGARRGGDAEAQSGESGGHEREGGGPGRELAGRRDRAQRARREEVSEGGGGAMNTVFDDDFGVGAFVIKTFAAPLSTRAAAARARRPHVAPPHFLEAAPAWSPVLPSHATIFSLSTCAASLYPPGPVTVNVTSSSARPHVVAKAVRVQIALERGLGLHRRQSLVHALVELRQDLHRDRGGELAVGHHLVQRVRQRHPERGSAAQLAILGRVGGKDFGAGQRGVAARKRRGRAIDREMALR